jgi:hypothetical protein
MKGLRLSWGDRSCGYEEVGNSGSGGGFTVSTTRMRSVMMSETAGRRSSLEKRQFACSSVMTLIRRQGMREAMATNSNVPHIPLL